MEAFRSMTEEAVVAGQAATPEPAHARTAREALRAEILDGLHAPAKHLPCKLLYDARGAELFEHITTLRAYYPTRTELGILEAALPELAALAGRHVHVVELGSGSGRKTRLLLQALQNPAAYTPIDISHSQLQQLALDLGAEFPELRVSPVAADYTREFHLPPRTPGHGRTIAFFPGSTIGNFEPEQALGFLHRMRALTGDDGYFLVGVDFVKDIRTLERAYNDPEGVTAAFNLNMLSHVNRLVGTDFSVARFRHAAIFDARASRIEMRLISFYAQVVRVREAAPIYFRPGEHIVTEHSYKYEPAAFAELAGRAGFRVQRLWTDHRRWFGVYLLARV